MESFQNISPGFALGGNFSDIDHFSEVARAWNLDFFQLDRGALEACLFQLGDQRFQLGEVRFSRVIEQHGVAPSGMRTFGIPASPFLRLRWRGMDVTAEDLLIFPRGGELYSISQPGFHVFTFSVREEVLLAQAERLGHPGIAGLLDAGVEAVTTHPRSMRRLVSACRAATADARRPGAPMTGPGTGSQLCDALTSRLVETLIDSSDAPPPRSPTPSVRRSRAIQRVRQVVWERGNTPVTVQQLCHESGVSARTLQYAFQEEFDMSPKSWLLARSLNNVRRDLRRAPAVGCTVADIANGRGFWHMGQFARDYRRMFGELPSSTLGREATVPTGHPTGNQPVTSSGY